MADINDDAVNTTAEQAIVKSATPGPNPVVHYLSEIWYELKKTNWPTRNELIKSVMIVIVTIVAVAIFLWLADKVAYQLAQIIGIAPKPVVGK